MVQAFLHSRVVEHPALHHEGQVIAMHPALYALICALLSGISLPIGAWLGHLLSPVSDRICGMMLAFGAGALLFAVAVELYGHALKEVKAGDIGLVEMFTTIFGALCGAAIYLIINTWLEEFLAQEWLLDPETPRPSSRETLSSRPLSARVSHWKRVLKDEQVSLEENSSASGSASPAPLASPSLEAHGARQEAWKEALGVSFASPEAIASPGQEAGEATAREADMWDMITNRCSATSQIASPRSESHARSREKVMRNVLKNPTDIQHAKSVAFALFLGLVIDGVPEGILMGCLAAEGHLTPVFIVALLVANFPEACSSASMMAQAKMSMLKVVSMWTGLCLMVGLFAGMSCYLLLWAFPAFGQGGLQSTELPMSVLVGVALIEGITGGAMIACIAAVMLPEAFSRAGKDGPFYCQSGFMCTIGFLFSVALKALFG